MFHGIALWHLVKFLHVFFIKIDCNIEMSHGIVMKTSISRFALCNSLLSACRLRISNMCSSILVAKELS